MPIEVRHDTSPGAVSVAQFATGRARGQRQMGKLYNDMFNQRRRADLYQQGLEQRQQTIDQRAAAFQLDIEESDRKGVLEGSLFFGPGQKKKMAEIDQWIEDERGSIDRSEEGRAKSIAELEAKRRRIRPIRRTAAEKPLSANEQARQDVIWASGVQGEGVPMLKDSKGESDIHPVYSRIMDDRIDYEKELRGERLGEGKDGEPERARYTEDQITALTEKKFPMPAHFLRERKAPTATSIDQYGEQPSPAPGGQPLAPAAGGDAQDRSTWGLRRDGTQKGEGWLGVLKMQDGRVMTEATVGVEFDGKEIDIPTLVPTLTKEETQFMQQGGDPRKHPTIMKKAITHAKQRMAQGKSVFADEQGAGAPPAPAQAPAQGGDTSFLPPPPGAPTGLPQDDPSAMAMSSDSLASLNQQQSSIDAEIEKIRSGGVPGLSRTTLGMTPEERRQLEQLGKQRETIVNEKGRMAKSSESKITFSTARLAGLTASMKRIKKPQRNMTPKEISDMKRWQEQYKAEEQKLARILQELEQAIE